ncbi:hypothetical protein DID80_01580 [Candidatus Marinamargulisbacteria bacterium SCGC AAA071-K20]|nr:hypothetical protein DID80_01580 [Candidatus Marinamargulisbacteria bacterium SCGC AAA071-K20]
MKKYTVYEIEKLTDGKLSKYKLTRAIHSGELKAESVKNQRKGRGTPNFYVYEDELKKYLGIVEQEKNRKIEIYDANESKNRRATEINDTVQTLMDNNKLLIENQSYKIDELLNRIQLLEKEQSQILPLLHENNNDKTKETEKSEQRRELLMELAQKDSISIDRKQTIFKTLNKLA